jgi:hypothetical protein
MRDQLHRQMQERMRLSSLHLSPFGLATFSSLSELLTGFEVSSIMSGEPGEEKTCDIKRLWSRERSM